MAALVLAQWSFCSALRMPSVRPSRLCCGAEQPHHQVLHQPMYVSWSDRRRPLIGLLGAAASLVAGAPLPARAAADDASRPAPLPKPVQKLFDRGIALQMKGEQSAALQLYNEVVEQEAGANQELGLDSNVEASRSW